MVPVAHDKLLFTPGPLTTSRTVKQAMLRDLGSRDAEFVSTVREIRDGLLMVAGTSRSEGHECVIMQGSGTYAVESVLGTALPRDGKLLVLVNGAYGRRMVQMASVLGIAVAVLETPENRCAEPEPLRRLLAEDGTITHVAAVHCETTTGVLNPVEELGEVVKQFQRCFIVDAMSSFGGIPLDLRQAPVDFLISSANKCIEGVPGFAFVIARRDALLSATHARSLSLDLQAQWRGLEENGQFRFTPPTHALLAFRQALVELAAEGGVAGRHRRYQSNHRELCRGMAKFGFAPYLPSHLQSPIITSFRYPGTRAFNFEAFYNALSDLGYVVYPGKLSSDDCFRIGTIGRIVPADVQALLAAIETAGKRCGFMDDSGRIVAGGNA